MANFVQSERCMLYGMMKPLYKATPMQQRGRRPIRLFGAIKSFYKVTPNREHMLGHFIFTPTADQLVLLMAGKSVEVTGEMVFTGRNAEEDYVPEP